jgi:hypothetical protein
MQLTVTIGKGAVFRRWEGWGGQSVYARQTRALEKDYVVAVVICIDIVFHLSGHLIEKTAKLILITLMLMKGARMSFL